MASRVMLLPLLVVSLALATGSATAIPGSPSSTAATDGVQQARGESIVLQATGTDASNLTVHAVARTSAPGMVGTHYYTVEIPNASDGTALESLRLNYGGTGADLTDLTHSRADLVRDPDSGNRTEIGLANVSVSVTNTTVTYQFPDTPTLRAGDELRVAISGVVNPAVSGPIEVGVQLDPTRNGFTGVATLDIGLPAPSISPQGVIGDGTRIGLHDPEGARGFIVAYRPDGTVIGTRPLDPDQTLHVDTRIDVFVDDRYQEDGMTVRLVAHRDSNRNGEFDPSVDEPYTVDGNPVEATVVNAVFQGATTTTSPTTASTTTRTAGGGTTTVSTSGTTRTNLPGFQAGVVLLALLGLAVLGHRD